MKKKPKTRPIAHDGAEPETRAQQFKNVVVIYEISRYEIEHRVTERLVHDLRVDPANPFIHAGPGRVVFEVSGYDDDPRELFEIPEFQAFLRKADKANPCWMYFAAPESLWLHAVLFCIAKRARASCSSPGYRALTFASAEIAAFLGSQMNDCLELSFLAKVPDEQFDEHLKRVFEGFGMRHFAQ